MLVDAVHRVKTAIFVDSTHDAFKNVTEDLGGLEGLKLPLVHEEILVRERMLEIVADVLL